MALRRKFTIPKPPPAPMAQTEQPYRGRLAESARLTGQAIRQGKMPNKVSAELLKQIPPQRTFEKLKPWRAPPSLDRSQLAEAARLTGQATRYGKYPTSITGKVLEQLPPSAKHFLLPERFPEQPEYGDDYERIIPEDLYEQIYPGGPPRLSPPRQPPPEVMSEEAQKAWADRMSALALAEYGEKAKSRYGTPVEGYVPEYSDIQPLQHVGEQFLKDLTPEARRFFMDVPTKVGTPTEWLLAAPAMALASMLYGQGFNLGYPSGTYGRMIEGRPGIDLNPWLTEFGMEYPMEVVTEHELLHSWDAEQLRRMQEEGRTLTKLPGILDWPRQQWTGGPGGSALAEADIPEDMLERMETLYGGAMVPPERFTMLSEISNFDPSAIPEEYQHLYEGLFTPEAFAKPPEVELPPLTIEDLQYMVDSGMNWEEFMLYRRRREALERILRQESGQ